MKLARRTLQPVTASKEDTRTEGSTSSYDPSSSAANGSQLMVASKSQGPRNSSSGGTRRRLSRKTRAAVEAWMQKLFLSDHQTKRSELTRRASTGSMTGNSSSSGGFEIDNSVEPRAKRRSSFFSSSRGKENSNASNAKKKKEKDALPQWLQPVASVPAIECEPQSSTSHTQRAPVSAPSLALHVHEPELQVHVVPPVEMPTNYRAQDRRGGMIVSGRAVLFTNAAFKRKLRNLSQLCVIPEHRPAQMLESRLDIYRSYMEASDPLSSSSSSVSSYGDDGDDEIVPLSQWI